MVADTSLAIPEVLWSIEHPDLLVGLAFIDLPAGVVIGPSAGELARLSLIHI